ncbi:TetR/AcrR family transcriptional regulator OS=Streptomyces tendae OX=1932 GN=GUR47_16425 PE=4 SV=1 [Streptomyces tendae]
MLVADTPLDPADTWREQALKASRGLRAALLAYRDGAEVFSGSRFTGAVHAEHMEGTLRLFTATGFTLAQAVRATSDDVHVQPRLRRRGTGRRAAARRAPGGLRRGQRARLLADYPLTAAAGAEIFTDYDRVGSRSPW